jgi:hypothetical protein
MIGSVLQSVTSVHSHLCGYVTQIGLGLGMHPPFNWGTNPSPFFVSLNGPEMGNGICHI